MHQSTQTNGTKKTADFFFAVDQDSKQTPPKTTMSHSQHKATGKFKCEQLMRQQATPGEEMLRRRELIG